MKSRNLPALDLEPVHSTRGAPASGVIPKARDATEAAVARVQALVDAAGGSFAARGIGNTTLAHIADGLGLRKSIVHYYFASKDQLLLSVQSHAAEQSLAAVQYAHETAGPNVEDFLTELWRAFRERKSLSELNIEFIAEARRRPDLRKLVTSVERRIQTKLRAALEKRHVAKEQSACLAYLITASFRGLSLSITLEHDPESEERAFECFARLAQLVAH